MIGKFIFTENNPRIFLKTQSSLIKIPEKQRQKDGPGVNALVVPPSLPLVHRSLHGGGCSVRRDRPLPVSQHGTPSVEAGEEACTLPLGSLYLGVPLSVWHWLLALLKQYNDFYTLSQ